MGNNETCVRGKDEWRVELTTHLQVVQRLKRANLYLCYLDVSWQAQGSFNVARRAFLLLKITFCELYRQCDIK
jgi:hypothetical protein